MLWGFECFICFTLTLKTGFSTGFQFFFDSAYSGCFGLLSTLSEWQRWSETRVRFFALEERGRREDGHRFEDASAGAGAERSGVQTSEGTTGQSGD